MKEVARRWLDRATEDLELLASSNPSRTPNASSVLCQQAVEKLLKACWAELGSRPPTIHELEELWAGIEVQVGFELDRNALDRLTPYGTQARYLTVNLSEQEALWAVQFCLETCSKLKSWLEARP
jgi:HEPN domain-containing protein